MNVADLRDMLMQDSAELLLQKWVLVQDYSVCRRVDGTLYVFNDLSTAKIASEAVSTEHAPCLVTSAEKMVDLISEQLRWLEAMEARRPG